MTALERPRSARLGICLDCHFGSERGPASSSATACMAAGHPRISFELDLFSTLQLHHNEDADYVARKGRSDSVRMWAVGQAMALSREMALFANPTRGNEGAFPEFYFFDCHSCHRRIFDQADRVKTWEANPGRPIPAGMPPFNDENMILLSAAARKSAHQVLPHASMPMPAPSTPPSPATAARRSPPPTGSARPPMRWPPRSATHRPAATVRLPWSMRSPARCCRRVTDYEGSAQGVMAIDTLLNALVKQGRVTTGAAAGIRANINRAYAVKDPNAYRPGDFRAALAEAVRGIKALR